MGLIEWLYRRRLLTGVNTVNHIHGPTASNNGNNFTEIAFAMFYIPTLCASSIGQTTSGTCVKNITLTAAQETDLLNGKYYYNVHTSKFFFGEIRGFLVPVV